MSTHYAKQTIIVIKANQIFSQEVSSSDEDAEKYIGNKSCMLKAVKKFRVSRDDSLGRPGT